MSLPIDIPGSCYFMLRLVAAETAKANTPAKKRSRASKAAATDGQEADGKAALTEQNRRRRHSKPEPKFGTVKAGDTQTGELPLHATPARSSLQLQIPCRTPLHLRLCTYCSMVLMSDCKTSKQQCTPLLCTDGTCPTTLPDAGGAKRRKVLRSTYNDKGEEVTELVWEKDDSSAEPDLEPATELSSQPADKAPPPSEPASAAAPAGMCALPNTESCKHDTAGTHPTQPWTRHP